LVQNRERIKPSFPGSSSVRFGSSFFLKAGSGSVRFHSFLLSGTACGYQGPDNMESHKLTTYIAKNLRDITVRRSGKNKTKFDFIS